MVVLVYCLGAAMARPTQETCVLECGKHLAESSIVGRIAAVENRYLHVVAWYVITPALVDQFGWAQLVLDCSTHSTGHRSVDELSKFLSRATIETGRS